MLVVNVKETKAVNFPRGCDFQGKWENEVIRKKKGEKKRW